MECCWLCPLSLAVIVSDSWMYPDELSGALHEAVNVIVLDPDSELEDNAREEGLKLVERYVAVLESLKATVPAKFGSPLMLTGTCTV